MQSLSNDASASRPSAGTGCKASTDLRVYLVLILKGCDLGKGSTAPRLRVVIKPSGGDAVSLAASPACYMMSFGPAGLAGLCWSSVTFSWLNYSLNYAIINKKRKTNMEHSEAYLLLSLLIENRLLVISYVELLKLLETLQGQGRITIEEGNQLLDRSEHLKNYDRAITE